MQNATERRSRPLHFPHTSLPYMPFWINLYIVWVLGGQWTKSLIGTQGLAAHYGQCYVKIFPWAIVELTSSAGRH
jgi:hypothetical protein